VRYPHSIPPKPFSALVAEEIRADKLAVEIFAEAVDLLLSAA
jgi:hypothetical protein